MNTPIVAAETHVVLAVNPAQHFAERDGLRDGEAGLRFTQALDAVAERNIGHTVIERNVVRHSHTDCRRGIIRGVGEEVNGVAAAAVPIDIRDARKAVIPDRVAGLHGIEV